jgi:integrase
MQAKSRLALVAPTGKKRAVTRGRRPNAAYRKREHLTETEIEKLIAAAKGNRYGHRDATMILVAFRHGLRASEICELTWDAIDFRAATMHVTRKKHGQPATIRFAVMNCGRCESCRRSRSLSRRCRKGHKVGPGLPRSQGGIGQLVAGGVADHVRMNPEGQAGLLAGPLHHPIEAVPGERGTTTFGCEHER